MYSAISGLHNINIKMNEYDYDKPVSNVIYGIGKQDTSSVDITFSRTFRRGIKLFTSGGTKNFPYKEQDNNPFTEMRIMMSLKKQITGKYTAKFNMFQYRAHSLTHSDAHNLIAVNLLDTRVDEGIFIYNLSIETVKNDSSDRDYGYRLSWTDNKTKFRNSLYPENVFFKERKLRNLFYYNFNFDGYKIESKVGFDYITDSFIFQDIDKNKFNTKKLFGAISIDKSIKKHNLIMNISANKRNTYGIEKSIRVRDIYNFDFNKNAYIDIRYSNLDTYLDLRNITIGNYRANGELKGESAYVLSAGTNMLLKDNFKIKFEIFNINRKNPVAFYEYDKFVKAENFPDFKYYGITLFMQKYIWSKIDLSMLYSGYFNTENKPVFAPQNSIRGIIRLRDIEDPIYDYPLKSEIIFSMNMNLNAKKVRYLPYINRYMLYYPNNFNYIVFDLRILAHIKSFTFFYQINNFNFQDYSLILNSPCGKFTTRYGVNWTFYN